MFPAGAGGSEILATESWQRGAANGAGSPPAGGGDACLWRPHAGIRFRGSCSGASGSARLPEALRQGGGCRPMGANTAFPSRGPVFRASWPPTARPQAPSRALRPQPRSLVRTAASVPLSVGSRISQNLLARSSWPRGTLETARNVAVDFRAALQGVLEKRQLPGREAAEGAGGSRRPPRAADGPPQCWG